MDRTAKLTLWTVAFGVSLAVAPLIWSVDAVAEGSSPGQDLFVAQKCNTCHAVSTVGIEAKMPKMKGPDLKGVGQRVDAATLGKYMRKEAKLNDADHKAEWKGTPEELEALIAWLNQQKAD